MNYKKILADLLKVVAGAIAGWLTAGCSFVPVFAN